MGNKINSFRWRDAAVELPKYDDDYIVLAHNIEGDSYFYCVLGYETDDLFGRTWVKLDEKCAWIDAEDEVIAWMPLDCPFDPSREQIYKD